MRFVRQPDRYSCGPIAILNACKWAGLSYTIKTHHQYLTRLCESTYDWGTDEPQFDRGLRLMSLGALKIRKRLKPTYGMLTEHLQKPDSAFIFLYWRKAHYLERNYDLPKEEDVVGHYTLVLPNDDRSVMFVNDKRNETTSRVSFHELKKRIKFMSNQKIDAPRAWLLQRVKL